MVAKSDCQWMNEQEWVKLTLNWNSWGREGGKEMDISQEVMSSQWKVEGDGVEGLAAAAAAAAPGGDEKRRSSNQQSE